MNLQFSKILQSIKSINNTNKSTIATPTTNNIKSTNTNNEKKKIIMRHVLQFFCKKGQKPDPIVNNEDTHTENDSNENQDDFNSSNDNNALSDKKVNFKSTSQNEETNDSENQSDNTAMNSNTENSENENLKDNFCTEEYTELQDALKETNDQILSKLTGIERDLEELKQWINQSVMKQFIDLGKEAAAQVEGKDIVVFIGTTGVGKTTTLNYLYGIRMILKEVTITNNKKQKITKEVITSNESIADIGYTSVSMTQFSKVIEFKDIKYKLTFMVDTPGFKDKRSVEIDTTNNLNIMSLLKECRSARFALLVNYHEFLTDRGAPFRDTLLIASKILNGKDFKQNLNSVTLLYSHVPAEVDSSKILNRILEIKEGLDELHMIEPEDRKLLSIFMDYMSSQLIKNQSIILNPLDPEGRMVALDKIFSKPGLQNPQEHISKFSFSQQSESRIQLYCNSVKEKIEFYNTSYQFSEVSQLLSLLYNLYDLIGDEAIYTCYDKCRNKVESGYRNKIDQLMKDTIDNLKNGNRLLENQLYELKRVCDSLENWTLQRGTHFSFSNVDTDYLNRTLCRKFDEIFQDVISDSKPFERLMKIVKAIEQLNGILTNESVQTMKTKTCHQLKEQLQKLTNQGFQKLQEVFKNNETEKRDTYVSQILWIINEISSQEEQLAKHNLSDIQGYKQQFIDKLIQSLKNFQDITNFMVLALKAIDPQSTNESSVEEKSVEVLLGNLEVITPLNQLLSTFALSSLLTEQCPEIKEVKANVDEKIREVKNLYLNEYTKQLTNKKLKSKYLKEVFMKFLKNFNLSFQDKDVQTIELSNKYFAEFESLVKKFEEKIKGLVKLLTQVNEDFGSLDSESNCSNSTNQQIPEKVIKKLKTFQSFSWVDSYLQNDLIQTRVKYCIEKLTKYFDNSALKVESCLEQFQNHKNIDMKRYHLKLLKRNYKCLSDYRKSFQTLIPTLAQKNDDVLANLTKKFTYLQDLYNRNLQRIKANPVLTKNQLFELEELLMCISYIPKDAINQLNLSERELIDTFDDSLKKQIQSIPIVQQSENLLDKPSEYYNSWRDLIEQLEIMKQNLQSLVILVDSSSLGDQIKSDDKEIPNKIKSLYKYLETNMEEQIKIPNLVKADKIQATMNYISAALTNTSLQFEYIYKTNQVIRNEFKSILSDMRQTTDLNDLKLRIQGVKDVPQYESDYKVIIQKLNEQYEIDLRTLLRKIFSMNEDDSDHENEIEDLYKKIAFYADLLEQKIVSEKYDTMFLQPLIRWSNDKLIVRCLQYKRIEDVQSLDTLLTWYQKIQSCLVSQNVDINLMANLQLLLAEAVKKDIEEYTHQQISQYTTENQILQIQNLIKQVRTYHNDLNTHTVLSDHLKISLNTARDYLTQQLSSQQRKFQDYCTSNPVNINEANKTITLLKRIDTILTTCFPEYSNSQLLQEYEQQLEEKQFNSTFKIQHYFESPLTSENEDNSMIQEILELSKKDKTSFKSVKVVISNKYKECNQELERFLSLEQQTYQQITSTLVQLVRINKFKQFLAQENVTLQVQTQTSMKRFYQLISDFQFQFKENLEGVSRSIQKSDITNYFEILHCLAILNNESYLNQREMQYIANENLHISNKLYEIVREAYNNFNKNYNNSNYKGVYNSLSMLKKVDDVITSVKKLSSNSQSLPSYFDKRLVELVSNSSNINHKSAEDKVEKMMKQVTKDLVTSYSNRNYQTFAQYLSNLKELHEDDPNNQLMTQGYGEIKQNYQQKIEGKSIEIQGSIRKEEWTDNLSSNVDDLLDQVTHFKTTDLCVVVNEANKSMECSLKEKLQEKLVQFKSETSIENKCSQLIDLRRVCDVIPSFETQVKKKVTECVDTLTANSKDGSKELLNLSNLLAKSNEPVAELIMKEAQQFSSINVKNFKDKIQGQHNPDYINANLKRLDISNKKKYNLSEEEQQNLKVKFQTYQENFTKLVDKYLKRLDCIDDLVQETLAFAKKKNNLNLDAWNKQSQDDCNTLLSYVCSLWTLTSLQQDSVNTEKDFVYRELHASQVFAIMVLLGFEHPTNNLKLGNQLIQVLTGEGKSIVLGILSILLALMNYNVNAVCYSEHLSVRDYNDFIKLFECLKIKDQIIYGTFTDICDNKVNEYGDVRKLSQSLLNGNVNTPPTSSNRKTILLIDEVDVFFSDSFFGQTYNPSCLFKTTEIIKLIFYIWENRGLSKQTLIEEINKNADYLEIIKKFPTMERVLRAHIRSMVNAAQTIQDHKYQFDKESGKVGYQIHDSISYSTFYGYSTNFAYFKEMEANNLTVEQVENICGINLQCGYFSYCLLPFLYDKILGVTGTLDTLDQKYLNIVKQYTQKATMIPSMFGQSRLQEDHQANFFVEFDENDYFLTIANKAQKYLESGQPVLVFFKDNGILKKFEDSPYCKQFQQENNKNFQVLNQSTKHIPSTVNKACRPGMLTLCDRAFGRGTDFFCTNQQVNKLGGMVVIQTFYSSDISEEFQVKGRTARQANEGIFVMVLFAPDIFETLHIPIDDLQKLVTVKSQLYQELDTKRQSLYAEKVQQLTNSATEAKKKHDQTLRYSECLQKNLTQEALDILLSFNTGKSVSSQEYFHFIFCLDDSGSMSDLDGTKQSRWERLVQSMYAFEKERTSNTLDDKDIASVIYYSSTSKQVANYQKISNLLPILNNNPPRFQYTNYYLAIDDAIKVLENEPAEYKTMKKVILFLSDGGDGASRQNLLSSLDNLKSKFKDNILGFWNIGFGPGAEAGALQAMTAHMKECGGQYKTAMNLQELQQSFQDLAIIDTVMTIK